MNGNMTRKLRPLAALAMVASIGAGCSNDSDGTGTGNDGAANQTQAVKFAECMRDNGVSEFPDPNASEGLTIDGVLNGSSLDPSSAAWKEAMGACRDLQPRNARAPISSARPGGPIGHERNRERPRLVLPVHVGDTSTEVRTEVRCSSPSEREPRIKSRTGRPADRAPPATPP